MVNVFALVDRAALDTFADETGDVVYHAVKSSPDRPIFTTRGIFDADHDLIFTEVANSEYSAAGHSTTGPVVGVMTTDLGLEPKQGDRLVIKGKTYRVHDVKPDGPTWRDLILKEVSA